ncbi:2Fe-2S iron-sulfur cluster-binding protein [Paenibacillus filicis]|uniref:2Fe-2S iron-sulfur cluster-binding protein n=1 Tax=Paenibacillus gyeongsangnamensis TaxID=3388067 RepID=A0ABT4Q7S7_9BACL|nr:2Fe-2S iron-sulfur cluster-binding protein [Paenibacillus filicis]MCZ8512930.1 2Fe-2S iron-sulfur cluster-binding protein [Paenibacillus filicis]
MAVITFLPSRKTLQVRPGTTVLGAAGKARVPIQVRCGGNASCLMCKIVVAPEHAAGLAPLTKNEQLKLGSLQESGYRLGCQAKITGDVTVSIPEDPLKSAIRRQLERQREEENGI